MNMRNRRYATVLLIFVIGLCALIPSVLKAQGFALTVLSIKSALEGAIEEFQQLESQMANDMISLGNSLQSNAQNVLADIDRMLGDKLKYTFDRLDETELRLVEDAQALTNQIEGASKAVLEKGGEEARQTIAEADILAYNASYSLPCRSAIPRIIISKPSRLTVKKSIPIVSLRGNFLRQGDKPKVIINGENARIVERLDNALSVEIPANILDTVKIEDKILTVKVEGLTAIQRDLRFWGLLGCSEYKEVVDAPPQALVVLEPPIYYSITGSASIISTTTSEVAEPVQNFENVGSDKCDDHYRVDRQWCITGEGTISNAEVSVYSINCRSSYEGWTPSGNRCVLVRGTVGGCGANRGAFNTWLGCKGRGWLKYNITLYKNISERTKSVEIEINKNGNPEERSFSFNYNSPSNLTDPAYEYNISIHKKKGNRTLESFSVSHANPNVGLITSRAKNGIISIEISE